MAIPTGPQKLRHKQVGGALTGSRKSSWGRTPGNLLGPLPGRANGLGDSRMNHSEVVSSPSGRTSRTSHQTPVLWHFD